MAVSMHTGMTRNRILFIVSVLILARGLYMFMRLAHRYSLSLSPPDNDNDNNRQIYLDIHNDNPNSNCWQVAENKLKNVIVDHKRHVIVDYFQTNQDMGNGLSEYWAARTLADLGGYHFEIPHDKIKVTKIKDSFLKFLPTHVNAKPKRLPELERVLCQCNNDMWRYAHVCQCGYAGPMMDIQRRDIRNALHRYVEAHYSSHHYLDANKTKESALFYYGGDTYDYWKGNGNVIAQEKQQIMGTFFQKNDWLIYERCVIPHHHLHGFGTLSVYDALPTTGTGNYTIYTMSGRLEGELPYLCEELHQIRDAYIRSRNPNVTIVKLEQMDRNVDFGRLVNAPNLLLPSAGSTWALWAAIANKGRIVTVKFRADHNDPTVPPSNFEVLWNATVLYPPQYNAESAKLLGFGDSSMVKTKEGKQILMECYRNC